MKAISEDWWADSFQGKNSFCEYGWWFCNHPPGKKGWEKGAEVGANKQWEKLARLEGDGSVYSPRALHALHEGLCLSILKAPSPPGCSAVPFISWSFCSTHCHGIQGAYICAAHWKNAVSTAQEVRVQSSAMPLCPVNPTVSRGCNLDKYSTSHL